MPIYEYKSTGSANCPLCKVKFELKQGLGEEPLKVCPQCGSEVRRLISRSFVSVTEPLSQEESFKTYTEEEADKLGLTDSFAPDQIWE